MYTVPPRFRQIDDEAECPQNLFEEEILDPTYLDRIQGDHIEKEHGEVADANLLRFFRNNGICEIPRQLIYKL